MNVFYFWEPFCQYLMPVNMSEVGLNRLLTPDPVYVLIPVKLNVSD